MSRPPLGLALGVRTTRSEGAALRAEWSDMCATLAATRPTAVNLFWAIERMRQRFRSLEPAGGETLRHGLLDEALAIQREDLAVLPPHGRPRGGAPARRGARPHPLQRGRPRHRRLRHGARRHPLRGSPGQGEGVFADETRPWLQGARLTAWELLQDGIPTTLIADNMAGHLMSRGEINAVVVGADRIAANGDVANKIGTYTVAILAKEHGIPFYVAAPVSTFDLAAPTGASIPIEERPADEVTHVAGRRIAPEGVLVRNPAFDVTPHRYVTAIICERGVARPPYAESLRALAGPAFPAGK